ncbi:NAD-dependent aldehyde dehydrogenase [Candidatus Mancarchaeum acidiphilum]|uniref:NAD-dependent aldehyde dehydrogenase n=1 Tax=Candidatus Mancarchaeum acidiphilum TaxID=1920749 RepID=A0A218NMD3_9ARCH|nr:D-glyceraldehyde dehydrogenase [Candidatus Mancarchaeum acidiphilum]ASI13627.1 NAD-dependent aldehyde dehydrogenase [Candidatus Mancarchaeum acidiphilum]
MKLFINGSWCSSSSGNTIEKLSPVTGKKMYNFPAATKDDVDNAIDAAYNSWEKWYSLGSVSRSKIIYKAKDLIEKNRKQLEDILVKENGKIRPEAVGEVDGVIDQLQYYAEFARKITGDIVEGEKANRKILQYKVPYGVVVAITPWNFPAAMVARKIAPALMTGNSVVLKPSSDTPGSAEFLVKMFLKAGIPKGVLNLVTGKGSEIGDYIIAHKKVSLVSMTGSTFTGQRIMEKASSNMAKLILELGGKAPFMVWEDADLNTALKVFMWAKYSNSGQSCIAAERLYVHERVFDKFMKMIAEASRKLTVGDPEKAKMGPLINKAALANMSKYVDEAKAEGGKVITGGGKPKLSKELKEGYFYEPTIVTGVSQESKLFQEEVFGPVIGAAKVSSFDEMLEKANDSKYGLASYLFTKDFKLANKAAEAVRFGELYINMPGPEASQGYHTGFRLTGQAGEGSKYGIAEYLKLKNVYIEY